MRPNAAVLPSNHAVRGTNEDGPASSYFGDGWHVADPNLLVSQGRRHAVPPRLLPSVKRFARLILCSGSSRDKRRWDSMIHPVEEGAHTIRLPSRAYLLVLPTA